MAQDPPELAWAVACVVVGVVVAGVSVVVVVELAAFADVDFADVDFADVDFVDCVDFVVVEVVLLADVVEGLAVVVDVAVPVDWCDVWVAARLANRATPARDAAATVPVILRVRRKISSRGEEEGISLLSFTGLGGS
jgi:hypothetical protein